MRRALALAALACLGAGCTLALGGCASTLQESAIPHNILESLIQAPYPVYWLGENFHGLTVSEAIHDPSDAYTIQYGGCLEGGEGSCVPPLRIVTSPDNSFVPGGAAIERATRIRGVRVWLANHHCTIVIATGAVVLDIYAQTPTVAAAAARTAVPINAIGEPEAPLPAALPNSGVGETPLSTQLPSQVREVG